MICKHQFFKTGETSRMAEPSTVTNPARAFIVGIEVVCVNCGQVRKAYADGKVEIKVEGGAPIDEDERTSR